MQGDLWLIYGNGWISSIIVNELRQLGKKFIVSTNRLENREAIDSEIKRLKPKFIINAAGKTGRPNVDWCEKNQEETIRSNVVGSLNLADVAFQNGKIHLTVLGSGCVYEYDELHKEFSGNGFKEEDPPNFSGSFYSKSKSMAQELLKSYSNVLLLRLRMPISSERNQPRSLLTKLLSYKNVISVENSITVLDEMIPIALKLTEKQAKGIYNFTNPGAISHNELLSLYKSIVDQSITWSNFTVSQQNEMLLAKRSNNLLDTSKLQKEFPELLPIKESLKKIFISMASKIQLASIPIQIDQNHINHHNNNNNNSNEPSLKKLKIENGFLGINNQNNEQNNNTNNNNFENNYVPKNILITGGLGFCGSAAVVYFLSKYNYKIVNLDKVDYCSSFRNVEMSKNFTNYKFVQGNVCSADLVRLVLEEEQIDTIIHFAAASHVDLSFGNSILFTKNNIFGTHVVLEAARVYGKIKRFVHVSTDEVYGETHTQMDAISPALKESDDWGRDEQTLLSPTNPYAASKAAAELLVQAYNKSFRLPTIITRGNNVYGPKQFPEKLIPKFVCLMELGRKLPIHGNGSHKRSFMYIDDVIRAFDVILHKGLLGEIYNIATRDEHSTLEVVADLLVLFGKISRQQLLNNSHSTAATKELLKEWVEWVEDRPFNDFRYALSQSKLESLGWRQTVGWEEGLLKTKQWYSQLISGGNPSQYWSEFNSALQPHPQIQNLRIESSL